MTRPDRKRRRLGQLGAAFVALLTLAAVATPAKADHRHHNGGSFSFGLSLPGPGYYEPPPTYYYAPPPRYYYAPPPPPAYYYPPPPPAYYYEPGPSINFGLGIGTNR